MGTNQRFHRGKNIPRSSSSSSKQDSQVGLGRAIFKFLTQGCLGTRKIHSRNRPFHPQETKHHHHQRMNQSYSSNGVMPPPVTLAEWIMNSPYLNSGSNHEGDSLMLISRSVSRRVHPSLGNRQPKDQEGFNPKRRTTPPVQKGNEDSLSFSASQQSGKLKKKVSFKEPEVADVFILKDSPQIS